MEWNTIGAILALLLTLMIFSYLLGENVLFRVAEHILVGVSVGWAILQILYGLLLPSLNRLQTSATDGRYGELMATLIPLLLGLLLLTRPLRGTRVFTNPIMALVVGTVATLSLAGALSGTLIPQIGATMLPLGEGDIFGRIVLLITTLVSLWYFQFTIAKSPRQEGQPLRGVQLLSSRVRLFGRWTIMLAFGAVFASVFLTYFAALVDRLLFLINFRI